MISWRTWGMRLADLQLRARVSLDALAVYHEELRKLRDEIDAILPAEEPTPLPEKTAGYVSESWRTGA